ncbi:MAG: glutamate--tRNA ligase [Candidatus Falkowbacteria bacterium]
MNNIRLRFAPSPTGFLHIGNFRVALFDYLIGQSLKGELILRIEYTDSKREVEGAADKLIKVLDIFNIKFNEGPHVGGPFAPYTQSERLDIYNKYSNQLLKEKKVYRCFCTEDRLTEMRSAQEANKLAPRYDRLCRDLSEEESDRRAAAGEPFVIRQKMPLEGKVVVHDELRGDITFDATDLDDQVLIKSNGVPTYQFASVVDDHTMEVSYVTRGDEWLSSYPKNILLYQALDWTPPKFIHFPLVLNKEGGKLSKRKGDVFVEDYLIKGYLPEAIINFCVLLGWHSKDDKEMYSLEELTSAFDINGLGSSPAVFDLERLDFFNGYYIRQKSLTELANLCRPYLSDTSIDQTQLEKVVGLAQDRMKKLSDINELTEFIFADKLEYETDLLIWKSLSLEEVKANLQEIKLMLEKVEDKDWNKESLESLLVGYIKSNEKKVGDYLWPLRVSLTGLKNSPGPFEVADTLGKVKSLARIEIALSK